MSTSPLSVAFGVLCNQHHVQNRFYEYYKAERNGAPSIGINTQYLFFLSISIIITHRVVSAFAVYTNYKLDTDQPTNSQRYLQTMEAIFESAPQILISTAFLIKTSQTTISVTVIASLLTSLFSLSSRGSADDKVMLQDDWKDLKYRESYPDGKWVFPCVNVKYLIRVFMWRFLD
eukprot:900943_1